MRGMGLSGGNGGLMQLTQPKEEQPHRVAELRRRGSIAPRNGQGFTLIEALIAMSILAFGFIATVTLITSTQVNNSMEQERARAHQIVSEEMEQVRHNLYTRITPGRQITVWDNGTPDDTLDDTTGNLTVTIRDPSGVELAAPPVPATRVEVEVTVDWNPRGRLAGKTLRETVMTYLSP